MLRFSTLRGISIAFVASKPKRTRLNDYKQTETGGGGGGRSSAFQVRNTSYHDVFENMIKKKSDAVMAEIDEVQFESEVLRSNRPVIVMFGRDGAPPARSLLP